MGRGWGGGGLEKRVSPKGEIHPLVGEGGLEEEKRLAAWQQEPITLIAAILDIKSPQTL